MKKLKKFEAFYNGTCYYIKAKDKRAALVQARRLIGAGTRALWSRFLLDEVQKFTY